MSTTSETIRLTSLSRGAGCACKLPMAKLEDLFVSLAPTLAPASGDLLIGAAEADDAAVFRLDDERALILTTDFFTPIVDSPYDWGRIAAANALSDVYAMGGRPLMAVNLAAWPGDSLPMELLGEVLRGGAEVAAAAGCPVVGGHTIDDPIPKYGMAVTGLADPGRLLGMDGVSAGDQLVLTKAIGTGVVATAHKNGAADDSQLSAAIASMTRLNDTAARLAVASGVRAATDVTGFGLLGHLHRMLRASGLSAEVYADQVPLLPGAAELCQSGFVPGGTRANMAHLADAVAIADGVPGHVSVLLHDAQTSGGLLLAVASPGSLLGDLRAEGITAAVIGTATAGDAGQISVRAAG
ncbi:MAG: selenide, water dikinase SelD [Actinobacteria bacterium]|nr:selenide, water dikinase SelD [Actinomycetota bacterium]